jgi:hypothetical protein
MGNNHKSLKSLNRDSFKHREAVAVQADRRRGLRG